MILNWVIVAAVILIGGLYLVADEWYNTSRPPLWPCGYVILALVFAITVPVVIAS